MDAPDDAAPQGAMAAAVDRRSAAWDRRSAPRNFVALVLSQIASSAASFGAVWVASRLLGPTGYGGLVALFAGGQLVYQVALHWTATYVARDGCAEFVRKGHIGEAFWTRSAFLAPKLALVLLAVNLWMPLLQRGLHIQAQLKPLMLAYVVALTVWIHVQQALQAAKLVRLQGRLVALERTVILAGLCFLLMAPRVNQLIVFSLYVASPLIASFMGLWAVRLLIFPIPPLSGQAWSALMRFSVPLIPFGLIAYMCSQHMDPFFILRYLSAAHLALYAVAYQVSGAVLQIPLMAGTLMQSLLVSLDDQVNNRRGSPLFLSVLPLFSLCWSVFCMLFAAVATILVPRIFGATYEPVKPLLWMLLAMVALAGPVLGGLVPLCNARSATYILTLNAAVGAVGNLTGNFLLIPRFGLLGCAAATVLAAISSLLITVLLCRRLAKGVERSAFACLPMLCATATYSSGAGTGAALAAGLSVALGFAFWMRERLREGMLTVLGTIRHRTLELAK